MMAATAPFQWGNNTGGIKSPAQVERERKVAAALLAPKAVAQDPWSGLAQVTSALSGSILDNRADEADAAGAADATSAFSALADGSGSNADIIAALSNPWVANDPSKSAIAQALLNQNLKAQDPSNALDLQYKQAQIDALNNKDTGVPEYFGSTLPYETADGNLGYVQLNKGGLPDLPEGARWLEPTSTVNTGTNQTVIGRNTGSVQGQIPIANADAAQQTAYGKGVGEQQITSVQAGQNAMSNNAKLDILEQTLANAPQGAQGGLTQFAGQFGVDIGGLDDVQAADAIISQMVPLQRAPGSGTMSDQDLALFKRSLPSIVNQPGGNQKIIATLRAVNQYTIAHAQIEDQLARGEITREQAIAAKAAIPNPLQGFNAANEAGGGDVDAILQKYGL